LAASAASLFAPTVAALDRIACARRLIVVQSCSAAGGHELVHQQAHLVTHGCLYLSVEGDIDRGVDH
jgi:hypothetical protein